MHDAISPSIIIVAHPTPPLDFCACHSSFSVRSDLQCGQILASREMASLHLGQYADPPGLCVYLSAI